NHQRWPSSTRRTIFVTDTPKTRFSLILRLKENADAEDWQQFCELYQPLIYRIGSLGGLQEADANDFVQDVLVRVAKSVSQFETDARLGSFRGWLGTIARNLLIDFLRQQSRLPITADGSGVARLIAELPGRGDETQLYESQFQKRIFLWAASEGKPSFRDSTWQAFWQTSVDQLPVDGVAEELGISTGAVYIARSRVIARLRSVIEAAQFDSVEIEKIDGGAQ
ncbi:sigma-70 family RNA polymerase sigma factor, partial [bacterium]|nr:sigma-70 family RNA polymerase sigma factor [bacterium]